MAVSILRAAAVAAVAVISSQSMAGVNLVVNGGFETGDFTGWSTAPAAMGSDFGVIGQPHTGDFAAVFSANESQNDEIFQSLVTEPGQDYILTYWIQNLGVGDDSLRVAFSGAFDLSAPVQTELENWIEVTVQFTATLPVSELRIGGYDNLSSFLIDDVSVVLVPTSGSAALALVAATFVLPGRRRRA